MTENMDTYIFIDGPNYFGSSQRHFRVDIEKLFSSLTTRYPDAKRKLWYERHYCCT